MTLTFSELKRRHREERANYSANLTLRVHRALSWLQRAELCEDELDGKFIFLWIAFNAAYANEFGDSDKISEQKTFKNFLDRICMLDTDKRIEQLVWQRFSESIRLLLDNPYVFQPFWEFHNGRLSEEEWKLRFRSAKNSAHKALGNRQTSSVLSIVFSRLYMLRNQLIHGGATWNSSVNREQLSDAINLLQELVPLVIKTMMDGANEVWGEAVYPVVS